jgi:hypothetical protein
MEQHLYQIEIGKTYPFPLMDIEKEHQKVKSGFGDTKPNRKLSNTKGYFDKTCDTFSTKVLI